MYKCCVSQGQGREYTKQDSQVKKSLEIYIFLEKNGSIICKQWRPDQTVHSSASDLGLHCLPITL